MDWRRVQSGVQYWRCETTVCAAVVCVVAEVDVPLLTACYTDIQCGDTQPTTAAAHCIATHRHTQYTLHYRPQSSTRTTD